MAQWLVVGLGNPGLSYARNRHNIGAMVVADLARQHRLTLKVRRPQKAETASFRLGANQIQLATSRTYMNLSGNPVRNLIHDARIQIDHLIVIHDELDLDLGQIRTKFGGGDNGHNGLKSIRSTLGTGDYYRVRVGIGRPEPGLDVTDWVLKNFTKVEAQTKADMVAKAGEVVELLVSNGLDATQAAYNS